MLKRFSVLQSGRRGRLGWTSRAMIAVAMAGAVATSTAAVSAAQVAPPRAAAARVAPAHASKSARVVKERHRAHFGKILVTLQGRALYVLPHGSCTGSCLGIWPPLLMPKGKTLPKGASCLRTAHFGAGHRLQVTYRRMRLYTFTGDSGTQVNGNGVAGFKVAKVVRCR